MILIALSIVIALILLSYILFDSLRDYSRYRELHFTELSCCTGEDISAQEIQDEEYSQYLKRKRESNGRAEKKGGSDNRRGPAK